MATSLGLPSFSFQSRTFFYFLFPFPVLSSTHRERLGNDERTIKVKMGKYELGKVNGSLKRQLEATSVTDMAEGERWIHR